MKTINLDAVVLSVLTSQGVTLKQMTKSLSALGYLSLSGEPLSESHVSNFRKQKLGLRFVDPYKKPGYAGKNWRSFIAQ